MGQAHTYTSTYIHTHTSTHPHTHTDTHLTRHQQRHLRLLSRANEGKGPSGMSPYKPARSSLPCADEPQKLCTHHESQRRPATEIKINVYV